MVFTHAAMVEVGATDEVVEVLPICSVTLSKMVPHVLAVGARILVVVVEGDCSIGVTL